MTRHILLFLLLTTLTARAAVGDLIINYQDNNTGPAAERRWTKTNSTIWGVDSTGTIKGFSLGTGLVVSGDTSVGLNTSTGGNWTADSDKVVQFQGNGDITATNTLTVVATTGTWKPQGQLQPDLITFSNVGGNLGRFYTMSLPPALSGSRFVYFPSASGTIARLEDITPAQLTQSGATPGQVLAWNGTIWAPVTGSSGTVTSVALTLPGIFSITGSPVTTSGTLSASLAAQAANSIFAGPTTGSDATPGFRSLVAADIPDLSAIYQPLVSFGTGVQSALGVNIGTAGAPVLFNGAGGTPSSMDGSNITNLNGSNISSGTVTISRLPVASQVNAEEGTYSGNVMTPLRTAQAIAAQTPLPRAYLSGLQTTFTGNIDVAAGVCRDDTNSVNMVLGATLTKNPAAVWKAGTGNGGMQSGIGLPASSIFSVWLIKNSSSGSVDVFLSTSATSPFLPPGYTYKRRIGWFISDASNAIIPWVQLGEEFILNTSQVNADYSAIPSTAADTLITLNAPPNVDVLLKASVSGTSGAWAVRIDHTSVTFSGAVTAETASMRGTSSTAPSAGHFTIPSDASSQVRVRTAGTNVTLKLTVRGWIDPRGRND